MKIRVKLNSMLVRRFKRWSMKISIQTRFLKMSWKTPLLLCSNKLWQYSTSWLRSTKRQLNTASINSFAKNYQMKRLNWKARLKIFKFFRTKSKKNWDFFSKRNKSKRERPLFYATKLPKFSKSKRQSCKESRFCKNI